jgi:hypothetical protein
MTNRSAIDGRQLAAHGSARDEALKRRSGEVRESAGNGIETKAGHRRARRANGER